MAPRPPNQATNGELRPHERRHLYRELLPRIAAAFRSLPAGLVRPAQP